jgi:tetratricopeptide (TPR) repeat protein
MVADAEHALANQPKAKIFISYSRKDLAFADRLDAALKARGFEPLIDRSEIYAFEDWWKRLQALIERADTVVFVLSPDAVASHEALREVEYAASLNKRFAPIVCRRVDEAATPEALRRLNFVFFDDPAQFEASADRLAEALHTDIGWIRKHTEYGDAARQWAAAGRPGGLQLRSPALEEAERWIASRPSDAPAPTADIQAFIADSRHGATRRRNILTGVLAAGLSVALVLGGLAYWQREVAVQQQQIAEQQRKRAEDTLAAATKTANSLVFDLAVRFKNSIGIPASLVKDILDRARALQDQLVNSGQVTPALKRSEGEALMETVDSRLTIGDTKGALAAAQQARQIFADLLAASPRSTDYQRELSVSYGKVGDVQVAQGDLPAALASYQAGLAIRDRLAKSDPHNAGWQRDLSVSYNKVGNVRVAQGHLPEALISYQAELTIADRLAKSDPHNAGWQRDLSVSYERVGNVQVAQGNLPAALASYQASLAIRDRLAKSDPGNAGWQRDLSVSYNKVGNVQVAQGDLPAALASYQASFAIADRLAKSDPGNAGWQRDLSVSYERLAFAFRKADDTTKALDALRHGRAIIVRMTNLSPDNAVWKRDLALFDEQIAQLTR